jgi:hypothetical protein
VCATGATAPGIVALHLHVCICTALITPSHEHTPHTPEQTHTGYTPRVYSKNSIHTRPCYDLPHTHTLTATHDTSNTSTSQSCTPLASDKQSRNPLFPAPACRHATALSPTRAAHSVHNTVLPTSQTTPLACCDRQPHIGPQAERNTLQ